MILILKRGDTMLLCKVTGSVISTRKNEKLRGCKFLIVEPLAAGGAFVAADQIGAGVGETVLVSCGSAARLAASADMPIDAAVIGIVDE